MVQSNQRIEWLVYQDNTSSRYIQPPMFRGGNLIPGVSPIRSSSPHVDFERRQLSPDRHLYVGIRATCCYIEDPNAQGPSPTVHSSVTPAGVPRDDRGTCPTGTGSSTSLPTPHFQRCNRAYTTQSSTSITRISNRHRRHCNKDRYLATPLSQQEHNDPESTSDTIMMNYESSIQECLR